MLQSVRSVGGATPLDCPAVDENVVCCSLSHLAHCPCFTMSPCPHTFPHTEWTSMYNPSREEAERDREEAFKSGVPHGEEG